MFLVKTKQEKKFPRGFNSKKKTSFVGRARTKILGSWHIYP